MAQIHSNNGSGNQSYQRRTIHLPSITEVGETELVEKITRLGGFFKDYIDYGRPLTDAPKVLHLVTAVGVLAGAMGNRIIYRSWGGGYRCPNLYLCAITPSGFYRKSTTVGIGRRLITEVDSECILPAEFSPEALLSRLEQRGDGIFFFDEVAHLSNQLERSYMQAGRPLFAELWDNTPLTRKLIKSNYKVKNPSVSIVSGTTAQFLEGNSLTKDIESGFWGRFLLIPARVKEPQPPSANPVPDPALWDELIRHVERVKDISGEVDFEHVETNITEWIADHEKIAESAGELMTFFSRSGEYLKKLCIVAEASLSPQLNQGKLIISPEAFTIGRMISEFHRRELPRLFAEELAFSWTDGHRRKIRQLLHAHGGKLEHSQILRSTHLTAKQLLTIKETMEETDEIQISERHTGTKSATIWTLK